MLGREVPPNRRNRSVYLFFRNIEWVRLTAFFLLIALSFIELTSWCFSARARFDTARKVRSDDSDTSESDIEEDDPATGNSNSNEQQHTAPEEDDQDNEALLATQTTEKAPDLGLAELTEVDPPDEQLSVPEPNLPLVEQQIKDAMQEELAKHLVSWTKLKSKQFSLVHLKMARLLRVL